MRQVPLFSAQAIAINPIDQSRNTYQVEIMKEVFVTAGERDIYTGDSGECPMKIHHACSVCPDR